MQTVLFSQSGEPIVADNVLQNPAINRRSRNRDGISASMKQLSPAKLRLSATLVIHQALMGNPSRLTGGACRHSGQVRR
jgi:hypothetical protein